jgi:hypothetical protein
MKTFKQNPKQCVLANESLQKIFLHKKKTTKHERNVF